MQKSGYKVVNFLKFIGNFDSLRVKHLYNVLSLTSLSPNLVSVLAIAAYDYQIFTPYNIFNCLMVYVCGQQVDCLICELVAQPAHKPVNVTKV